MKRSWLIALVALIALVVVVLVVASRRGGNNSQSPATQNPPTTAPPTKAPPTSAPPTTVPPTSAPKPTENPIQDILWKWTIVTNRSTGETTTISDPKNYTLSFFADGTLEGKADCNTFGGTYSQVNGFSIKLGPSTEMYCGDSSLDQQFLQLLGSVAAGGPDGQGYLALETAGGEQRMLFENGGRASK